MRVSNRNGNPPQSLPRLILERIAGLQARWGESGCIRLVPSLVLDSVTVNWCGHDLHWEQDAKALRLDATFKEPAAVEFVLPYAPGDVQTLRIDGKEQPIEPVSRLEGCTGLEVEVVIA